MLRLAQPSAGQRLPPTGGAGNGDGDGSRRPRWSDGWEARALLAAAGGLYFAAAESAPFDRVDAWIDARFFWEPIAVAVVALLLLVIVTGHLERRRLAGQDPASSPDGAPSELVPICVRCKAVRDENEVLGADRGLPRPAHAGQVHTFALPRLSRAPRRLTCSRLPGSSSAHHAPHHGRHSVAHEAGDLACVVTNGLGQAGIVRCLGDHHSLRAS